MNRTKLIMNRKAVAMLGLCCGLPILLAVPGISTYPLCVAGGICVAAIGINLPSSDELMNERISEDLRTNVIMSGFGEYDDREELRDRAKACST